MLQFLLWETRKYHISLPLLPFSSHHTERNEGPQCSSYPGPRAHTGKWQCTLAVTPTLNLLLPLRPILAFWGHILLHQEGPRTQPGPQRNACTNSVAESLCSGWRWGSRHPRLCRAEQGVVPNPVWPPGDSQPSSCKAEWGRSMDAGSRVGASNENQESSVRAKGRKALWGEGWPLAGRGRTHTQRPQGL